ncbi:hypothetical protein EIKCOROL_01101 [Eikenella corrodens ATCC 23834]|uniref:Uncharacterized protein n=1 Tax=Eikenella corrodens ATCC 23834 TaxID=546274 RepID=C0DUR5_EIKCO|nr:hypothetical protein EIKCOROL_01101 [Eikenella corrodens ATCC 23834]
MFQVAFLAGKFVRCRVRASGTHAVAHLPSCRIPKPRACVPHTPYIPHMSRLPETIFSGSLLIGQGVGWVGKPNISL